MFFNQRGPENVDSLVEDMNILILIFGQLFVLQLCSAVVQYSCSAGFENN